MRKSLILIIAIVISIVAKSQVIYSPNVIYAFESDFWIRNTFKAAHVTDIDSDGDEDVYLQYETRERLTFPSSTFLYNYYLVWLENTGAGFEAKDTITHGYSSVFGLGSRNLSHKYFDIDQDGDDDLFSYVVSTSSNPTTSTNYHLSWSEHMGDGVFDHKGPFVSSTVSIISQFGGPIRYQIIDIDNDEFVDLMVTMNNDFGQPFISWYEFDSINFDFVDTLFNSEIEIYKIADVNNDQFEDIINANLTWQKNDGNGIFTDMGFLSNSFPEYIYSYVTDIDGDNDLDFIFVDSFPKIYQSLNDGTGQFAMPQLIYEFPHNATTRIRHFSDIDQDNDIDIILHNIEDKLAILYNQGGQIYEDILPVTSLFGYPPGLKIADFNEDDELDIFLFNGSHLRYYEYAIDTIPPKANCYYSINKYLSNDGLATIARSDIDSASYDNFQIQSFILSDTEVDCEDVGISNLVELMVIDLANDTSVCTTIVQTFDTIKPILECLDISYEIALGDTIYITFDSIATVTDNCGIVTQEISQSEFYVSDAIDYQVEVFVEDEHGNTCICNSTVTIDILTNSIINKSDISLRLFPNPMSKSINLQLHINNISPYDVKVYDSKGRLVHQVANSLERNLEIEGAWLSAGAFSIVVSDHETNEILGSSKLIVR